MGILIFIWTLKRKWFVNHGSTLCKVGKNEMPMNLPEPVESITCPTSAKLNFVSGPRRFVDLPGLTFTRSLSGCLMRSAEEHWVKLTKAKDAADNV